MNVLVLRNERDGAAIGAVAKAEAYWDRVVGLLRSNSVATGEGMWLEPCGAIHTIGMRSSVDVIFLDRDSRVLRIHGRVPPNRLALICPGAHITVELGPGTLEHHAIELGDRLSLEPAVSIVS